jgi:hypothetical protein
MRRELKEVRREPSVRRSRCRGEDQVFVHHGQRARSPRTRTTLLMPRRAFAACDRKFSFRSRLQWGLTPCTFFRAKVDTKVSHFDPMFVPQAVRSMHSPGPSNSYNAGCAPPECLAPPNLAHFPPVQPSESIIENVADYTASGASSSGSQSNVRNARPTCFFRSQIAASRASQVKNQWYRIV